MLRWLVTYPSDDKSFTLFAVFFIFVGVIILAASLTNWRRRKRVLATLNSPIATAPGTGSVEIKGRIAPSDQGLLNAPFSDRQCVWYIAEVYENRGTKDEVSWVSILRESNRCAFLVDDGSGQLARILPKGANVIAGSQEVASSNRSNAAAPRIETFLVSRGLSNKKRETLSYREAVLVPGEELYAIGPSRRDAGPPIVSGYRDAPSSELVLFANGKADGELILTTKSKRELVSFLGASVVVGSVLTGVGILFGIAAIAKSFISTK
ncbi:MAG: E3 ubiquitin ligase family protein [Polyangiaceae bacterium]|nr:E3 ubiquitin ligase family protein [Polyangiaceae bacterium]